MALHGHDQHAARPLPGYDRQECGDDPPPDGGRVRLRTRGVGFDARRPRGAADRPERDRPRRIDMKRLVFLAIVAVAFGLMVGSAISYAPGTFTIPLKFQAGRKKFPAGEYWVVPKGERT